MMKKRQSKNLALLLCATTMVGMYGSTIAWAAPVALPGWNPKEVITGGGILNAEKSANSYDRIRGISRDVGENNAKGTTYILDEYLGVNNLMTNGGKITLTQDGTITAQKLVIGGQDVTEAITNSKGFFDRITRLETKTQGITADQDNTNIKSTNINLSGTVNVNDKLIIDTTGNLTTGGNITATEVSVGNIKLSQLGDLTTLAGTMQGQGTLVGALNKLEEKTAGISRAGGITTIDNLNLSTPDGVVNNVGKSIVTLQTTVGDAGSGLVKEVNTLKESIKGLDTEGLVALKAKTAGFTRVGSTTTFSDKLMAQAGLEVTGNITATGEISVGKIKLSQIGDLDQLKVTTSEASKTLVGALNTLNSNLTAEAAARAEAIKNAIEQEAAARNTAITAQVGDRAQLNGALSNKTLVDAINTVDTRTSTLVHTKDNTVIQDTKINLKAAQQIKMNDQVLIDASGKLYLNGATNDDDVATALGKKATAADLTELNRKLGTLYEADGQFKSGVIANGNFTVNGTLKVGQIENVETTINGLTVATKGIGFKTDTNATYMDKLELTGSEGKVADVGKAIVDLQSNTAKQKDLEALQQTVGGADSGLVQKVAALEKNTTGLTHQEGTTTLAATKINLQGDTQVTGSLKANDVETSAGIKLSQLGNIDNLKGKVANAGTLVGALNTLDTELATEVTAREQSIAAAVKSEKEAREQALSTEKSAREAADTALGARLTIVEGNVTGISRVGSNTTIVADKLTLAGATTITGDLTVKDTNILEALGAKAAQTDLTALNTKVDSLYAGPGQLKTNTSVAGDFTVTGALQANSLTLNGNVNVGEVLTGHSTAINNLQTTVGDASSGLVKSVNTNTADITQLKNALGQDGGEALVGRVTALEGKTTGFGREASTTTFTDKLVAENGLEVKGGLTANQVTAGEISLSQMGKVGDLTGELQGQSTVVGALNKLDTGLTAAERALGANKAALEQEVADRRAAVETETTAREQVVGTLANLKDEIKNHPSYSKNPNLVNAINAENELRQAGDTQLKSAIQSVNTRTEGIGRQEGYTTIDRLTLTGEGGYIQNVGQTLVEVSKKVNDRDDVIISLSQKTTGISYEGNGGITTISGTLMVDKINVAEAIKKLQTEGPADLTERIVKLEGTISKDENGTTTTIKNTKINLEGNTTITGQLLVGEVDVAASLKTNQEGLAAERMEREQQGQEFSTTLADHTQRLADHTVQLAPLSQTITGSKVIADGTKVAGDFKVEGKLTFNDGTDVQDSLKTLQGKTQDIKYEGGFTKIGHLAITDPSNQVLDVGKAINDLQKEVGLGSENGLGNRITALEGKTSYLSTSGSTTTLASDVVINKGLTINATDPAAEQKVTLNNKGLTIGSQTAHVGADGMYLGGADYTSAVAGIDKEGNLKAAGGSFTVDKLGQTTAKDLQLTAAGISSVGQALKDIQANTDFIKHNHEAGKTTVLGEMIFDVDREHSGAKKVAIDQKGIFLGYTENEVGKKTAGDVYIGYEGIYLGYENNPADPQSNTAKVGISKNGSIVGMEGAFFADAKEKNIRIDFTKIADAGDKEIAAANKMTIDKNGLSVGYVKITGTDVLLGDGIKLSNLKNIGSIERTPLGGDTYRTSITDKEISLKGTTTINDNIVLDQTSMTLKDGVTHTHSRLDNKGLYVGVPQDGRVENARASLTSDGSLRAAGGQFLIDGSNGRVTSTAGVSLAEKQFRVSDEGRLEIGEAEGAAVTLSKLGSSFNYGLDDQGKNNNVAIDKKGVTIGSGTNATYISGSEVSIAVGENSRIKLSDLGAITTLNKDLSELAANKPGGVSLVNVVNVLDQRTSAISHAGSVTTINGKLKLNGDVVIEDVAGEIDRIKKDIIDKEVGHLEDGAFIKSELASLQAKTAGLTRSGEGDNHTTKLEDNNLVLKGATTINDKLFVDESGNVALKNATAEGMENAIVLNNNGSASLAKGKLTVDTNGQLQAAEVQVGDVKLSQLGQLDFSGTGLEGSTTAAGAIRALDSRTAGLGYDAAKQETTITGKLNLGDIKDVGATIGKLNEQLNSTNNLESRIKTVEDNTFAVERTVKGQSGAGTTTITDSKIVLQGNEKGQADIVVDGKLQLDGLGDVAKAVKANQSGLAQELTARQEADTVLNDKIIVNQATIAAATKNVGNLDILTQELRDKAAAGPEGSNLVNALNAEYELRSAADTAQTQRLGDLEGKTVGLERNLIIGNKHETMLKDDQITINGKTIINDKLVVDASGSLFIDGVNVNQALQGMTKNEDVVKLQETVYHEGTGLVAKTTGLSYANSTTTIGQGLVVTGNAEIKGGLTASSLQLSNVANVGDAIVALQGSSAALDTKVNQAAEALKDLQTSLGGDTDGLVGKVKALEAKTTTLARAKGQDDGYTTTLADDKIILKGETTINNKVMVGSDGNIKTTGSIDIQGSVNIKGHDLETTLNKKAEKSALDSLNNVVTGGSDGLVSKVANLEAKTAGITKSAEGTTLVATNLVLDAKTTIKGNTEILGTLRLTGLEKDVTATIQGQTGLIADNAKAIEANKTTIDVNQGNIKANKAAIGDLSQLKVAGANLVTALNNEFDARAEVSNKIHGISRDTQQGITTIADNKLNLNAAITINDKITLDNAGIKLLNEKFSVSMEGAVVASRLSLPGYEDVGATLAEGGQRLQQLEQKTTGISRSEDGYTKIDKLQLTDGAGQVADVGSAIIALQQEKAGQEELNNLKAQVGTAQDNISSMQTKTTALSYDAGVTTLAGNTKITGTLALQGIEDVAGKLGELETLIGGNEAGTGSLAARLSKVEGQTKYIRAEDNKTIIKGALVLEKATGEGPVTITAVSMQQMTDQLAANTKTLAEQQASLVPLEATITGKKELAGDTKAKGNFHVEQQLTVGTDFFLGSKNVGAALAALENKTGQISYRDNKTIISGQLSVGDVGNVAQAITDLQNQVGEKTSQVGSLESRLAGVEQNTGAVVRTKAIVDGQNESTTTINDTNIRLVGKKINLDGNANISGSLSLSGIGDVKTFLNRDAAALQTEVGERQTQDKLLQEAISRNSQAITGNVEQLNTKATALEEAIKAEAAARNTWFGDLQNLPEAITTDEDFVKAPNAVNALAAEYKQRTAEDTRLAGLITTNQQGLATEISDRQKAITDLDTRISANAQLLETSKEQLLKNTIAIGDTSKLRGELQSNSPEKASNLVDALNKGYGLLEQRDTELAAGVASNKATLEDHTRSITGLEKTVLGEKRLAGGTTVEGSLTVTDQLLVNNVNIGSSLKDLTDKTASLNYSNGKLSINSDVAINKLQVGSISNVAEAITALQQQLGDGTSSGTGSLSGRLAKVEEATQHVYHSQDKTSLIDKELELKGKTSIIGDTSITGKLLLDGVGNVAESITKNTAALAEEARLRQSAIGAEATAREQADADLRSSIESNSAGLTANSEALAQNTQRLGSLASLHQELSGAMSLVEALNKEHTLAQQADAALEGKITTNAGSITALQQTITGVKQLADGTTVAGGLTVTGKLLLGEQDVAASLQGLTAKTQQLSYANGLTTLEGKLSLGSLTDVEAEITALKNELGGIGTGGEQSLSTRLGLVETATSTLQQSVTEQGTKLEQEITAREQALSQEVSDRNAAIKAQTDILTGKLEAEAGARAEALSQEATAREQAIRAEAKARLDKDTSLEAAIEQNKADLATYAGKIQEQGDKLGNLNNLHSDLKKSTTDTGTLVEAVNKEYELLKAGDSALAESIATQGSTLQQQGATLAGLEKTIVGEKQLAGGITVKGEMLVEKDLKINEKLLVGGVNIGTAVGALQQQTANIKGEGSLTTITGQLTLGGLTNVEQSIKDLQTAVGTGGTDSLATRLAKVEQATTGLEHRQQGTKGVTTLVADEIQLRGKTNINGLTVAQDGSVSGLGKGFTITAQGGASFTFLSITDPADPGKKIDLSSLGNIDNLNPQLQESFTNTSTKPTLVGAVNLLDQRTSGIKHTNTAGGTTEIDGILKLTGISGVADVGKELIALKDKVSKAEIEGTENAALIIQRLDKLEGNTLGITRDAAKGITSINGKTVINDRVTFGQDGNVEIEKANITIKDGSEAKINLGGDGSASLASGKVQISQAGQLTATEVTAGESSLSSLGRVDFTGTGLAGQKTAVEAIKALDMRTNGISYSGGVRTIAGTTVHEGQLQLGSLQLGNIENVETEIKNLWSQLGGDSAEGLENVGTRLQKLEANTKLITSDGSKTTIKGALVLQEGEQSFTLSATGMEKLQSSITANSAAIAAEATARDQAIAEQLRAEATARNEAISTKLAEEAEARATAITNAVNNEASARNDAIAAAITKEVSDRDGAIKLERDARIAKDAELGSSLTAANEKLGQQQLAIKANKEALGNLTDLHAELKQAPDQSGTLVQAVNKGYELLQQEDTKLQEQITTNKETVAANSSKVSELQQTVVGVKKLASGTSVGGDFLIEGKLQLGGYNVGDELTKLTNLSYAEGNTKLQGTLTLGSILDVEQSIKNIEAELGGTGTGSGGADSLSSRIQRLETATTGLQHQVDPSGSTTTVTADRIKLDGATSITKLELGSIKDVETNLLQQQKLNKALALGMTEVDSRVGSLDKLDANLKEQQGYQDNKSLVGALNAEASLRAQAVTDLNQRLQNITAGGADGKQTNIAGDLTLGGKLILQGGSGKDLVLENEDGYIILNKGLEKQIKLGPDGITVGLHSTHFDEKGFYAGRIDEALSHSYENAQAGFNEAGGLKAAGGRFTVAAGSGNTTIKGKLTLGDIGDVEQSIKDLQANIGSGGTVSDARVTELEEKTETIIHEQNSGKTTIKDDQIKLDGQVEVSGSLTVKDQNGNKLDVGATLGNHENRLDQLEKGLSGTDAIKRDETTETTTIEDKNINLKGNITLNGGTDNQVVADDKGLTVGKNANVKLDNTGIYVGKDGEQSKASIKTDGSLEAADGKFKVSAEGKLAIDGYEDVGAAMDNLSGSLGELGSSLSKLDGKMNKAAAGAAALAALQPMSYDPDDKLSFSAGFGSYGGASASAIGAFYRPNEKVMVSLGSTLGNGEDMVNMGLSFALDRNEGLKKYRRDMAKELLGVVQNNMDKQNAQIDQLITIVNHLTKLQGGTTEHQTAAGSSTGEVIYPNIGPNIWAYEGLYKLIATGLLNDFPENYFTANHIMTRYEFAKMLYFVLRKGAVIDEKLLHEFGPELSRLRMEHVQELEVDNKNEIRELEYQLG